MPEREKRLSRRKFLLALAGVALGMAGCERERSVTPSPRPQPRRVPEPERISESGRAKETQIAPQEPTPLTEKELAQEAPKEETVFPKPEEEKEIWSLEEIQKHYPLVIENRSSFPFGGVYRQRFEEVMKKAKVNKGQFLGITFEDIVDPRGEKTVETTLMIFKIKEGGRETESFPGFVSMAHEIPLPGLTTEEELAMAATVSLKVLLTYATYLQPYLADDQLTREEFFKTQQTFNLGGVREAIIKEVLEDKENKIIFVFSLPSFEI